MKESYYLATIGLLPSIHNKLLNIIKPYHPNINAFYFKDLGHLKEKSFHIIVLNTSFYYKNLNEVILKLRNINPLSQIILLSNKEDYKLAIMALRLNIRDIITLPLSPKGIINSFRRTLGHLTIAEKKSKIAPILELVNIFSCEKRLQNLCNFYKSLNFFIINRLNSLGLFVIQIPTYIEYEKDLLHSKIKIVWNKKLCNQILSPKGFYQLIDYFIEKKITKRYSYINLKFENKIFYFMELGRLNQKAFIGIIPSNEKITFHVEDILQEYFKKITRNIFKSSIYRQQKKKLSVLAHTDDVTGLFNQRKLDVDLSTFTHNYQKSKEIFSILFIDIDYFKKVNDIYGHLIGGQILVEMALDLKNIIRESDLIYRYGGDEFVVILQKTDIKQSANIGNRIIDYIKEKKYKIGPSNFEESFIKLSVSIGVAEFPRNAHTKDQILSFADDMMYTAKKRGRGKVYFAGHINLSNSRKHMFELEV